ncbi:MAG: TonB-dependent receptor [bacterium]
MKHSIAVRISSFFILSLSLQVLFAQDHLPSSEFFLDSLLNIKVNTSTKYWKTATEYPASITILTSEEILRFGYSNIGEMISMLRSVYTSYDRNYTYVGVRGFGRPTDYSNRILLLLDGATLNENFYGSASLGSDLVLNPNVIERVELVRGPGGSLYGSGAMFAIINIITKKGNDIDGLNLSIRQGSDAQRQVGAVFGKRFKNDLDFLCSAYWGDSKGRDLYFREYDSDSTNFGIAQNLDWEHYYGFSASLSYDALFTRLLYSSRSKGIPTAAYGTLFNDSRCKTLDENTVLELGYEYQITPGVELTLRSYYNSYYYEGTYPYAEVAFDRTRTQKYGGEIRALWDFSTNNRLIAGMEYANISRADFQYWSSTTRFFDGNFPFLILSLYLQDEYQLTKDLSLTLGIRRDQYSRVGSSTSPRFAVVYHPFPTTSLKLLYGEAFRAPNIYEAEYIDPLQNFIRNPQIKPERGKTFECIWEERIGSSLHTVVSLFQYTVSDLIDQVLNEENGSYQFQNISKVRAYGFEGELTAELTSHIRATGVYTMQHVENIASRQRLTNSPLHLAKGIVNTVIQEGVQCGIEMEYQSSRLTIYDTQTKGFTLAHVSVSFEPWSVFKVITQSFPGSLRFIFRLNNIFDQQYSFPGGFEHAQPEIFQNGRNYSLRCDIRF